VAQPFSNDGWEGSPIVVPLGSGISEGARGPKKTIFELDHGRKVKRAMKKGYVDRNERLKAIVETYQVRKEEGRILEYPDSCGKYAPGIGS